MLLPPLPRGLPPGHRPGDSDVYRPPSGRCPGLPALASRGGKLAEYARSLKPDTVISANDFDAVMRPSYLILGIDLPALEDYGLPRWEAKEGLLVNNALTLRVARALAKGTPVSTISYDRGIGFDGVYPPRRFRQAMAEAAACGAIPVIKGTEYVERGVFTLLTAAEYAPQREAIGHYHRWLESHAELYREWEPAAFVGLLYPGDTLWQQWPTVAPIFFGAAQTLTAAGIPWRVIQDTDDCSGLDLILDARPGAKSQPGGFPRRVGRPSSEPALWARSPWLRNRVQATIIRLYRAYFESPFARRWFDRMGMVRSFTQSPYFRLPPEPWQQALLRMLEPLSGPRVEAKNPVLLEVWQNFRKGTKALHLVNYADVPQEVRVKVGEKARARLLTPDGEGKELEGQELSFTLDIYAVILLSG